MEILENIPLASFTTFNIGGKARFFVSVRSKEEMKKALLFSKEKKLPFFLLGKGSNCLFDDRGFLGLVIYNRIVFLDFRKNLVDVGSGTSFANLGRTTAKQGLTGLEFASGIPATVGGAIYMNAGSGKYSTWDVLHTICYLNENLEEITKEKKYFTYCYRFSSFQETKNVILSATFQLTECAKAKDRLNQMLSYRIATQPYNQKSAGCIFQNPKRISAGALIDQCGLKGKYIGKAKVSLQHGNFIVAEKGCTSADIQALIFFIRNTVKEKTGIELQTEVRVIPYES